MDILLSIIIVNWNVSDLLIGAIQSILDNPPSCDFELIVVDNASIDDSLEKLSKHYPKVLTVKNTENIGFGKANNQGIEIAKGEYILLLNPDTVIIGDAIETLIRALNKHPEVGMVGPKLLTKELEPQLGGARLSRTFISGILLDLLFVGRIPWLGNKIVKSMRYPYDPDVESYVEVISGAAMLFKRSTIDFVGRFDERFFLAGEDIELCDRFWEKGLKILYMPSAKIIHYNQSCTPVDPVRVFVNKFMGVAKYYQIKSGKVAHLTFRILTYLVLTPKLLLKSLIALVRSNGSNAKYHIEILRQLIRWKINA
jgi:hypothetical protein